MSEKEVSSRLIIMSQEYLAKSHALARGPIPAPEDYGPGSPAGDIDQTKLAWSVAGCRPRASTPRKRDPCTPEEARRVSDGPRPIGASVWAGLRLFRPAGGQLGISTLSITWMTPFGWRHSTAFEALPLGRGWSAPGP